MLDELGDVLFQVHFLALLLEERGRGDLAAVAEHAREKLIRRHPHVFGGAEARTSAEVRSNWEQIKREQEGRGEPFADLPQTLPALLYARRAQGRAEQAPDPAAGRAAALSALEEAVGALRDAVGRGADGGPTADPRDRERADRLLGELLLSAVGLARHLHTDPELALRAAADRLSGQAAKGA